MKLLCVIILSIMAVVSAVQYIDCGKLSVVTTVAMQVAQLLLTLISINSVILHILITR